MHYSGCGRGKGAEKHYVYAVEVPEMAEGNHIWSNRPVEQTIVTRAETELGEKIPAEVCGKGKLFRKYIGNRLMGATGTWRQLSNKADLEAEKAVARFLLNIGVEMLVWPYAQTKPEGIQNRAILDDSKVKIVKVEEVKKALKHGISEFVKEYYPEYYQWNTYPVDDCVCIRKISEEWGIFGNFARTPIVVDGVTFRSAEHLYHTMKFADGQSVCEMYRKNSKQWAKRLENEDKRRHDWGSMLIDAMKFCLMMKYVQVPEFRQELERSRGKYIVEDESKRRVSTWGAKLRGDHYEGSNLLGRLLMELRDDGRLDYTLPADALDFISFLKE
ncbi:MAG: NADAR family protein [Bacteroidales bacterium]|nr:NADAR family protein [Bacteroidales bacterium]